MMKYVLFMMLALTIVTAAAHADVTEYGNDERDQWFSDVGGGSNVSTVDFTGLPHFTPVTDQWANLGVEFSSSFGVVLSLGPSPTLFPQDGFGVEAEPDIIATFDQPMNWIAADFPGTMIIELFSGSEMIYQSEFFGGSGAGHFGGLVSDESFDRAVIFDPFDSLVVMDDLHFGPPIPAPASLAPVAMMMCLRPTRRRRR